MREHSLGIMYEVVKESSYSAEVVIRTVLNSRKQCYDDNCLSEPLTLDTGIHDYDPLQHGFNVTEMFKRGKCFLKKDYTGCIKKN